MSAQWSATVAVTHRDWNVPDITSGTFQSFTSPTRRGQLESLASATPTHSIPERPRPLMTRIHPAAVTDSPDPQRALRHRPRALLLDFGGVVFETSKRPEGRAELARLYGHILDDAGFEIPHDRLAASIDAGLAALKYWKNASSRRLEPVELTHRQVITDFMVSVCI